MKTALKKSSPVLFLLMFILAPFGAIPAGADQAEKPVIVASTTQIADFARQVAGDQAVVKSILAPGGGSPHL